MAPALIPTLMMLTTASYHSSNFGLCETMPPELVGVWVGPDKWVDEGEIGLCEPAYAAFKEGFTCSYSWLEACSPGEFAIEDSYLYSITSYKCIGAAEGYVYDVENTSGMHSCNYYKRADDKLTYIYGHRVDNADDVVCPDPSSEVGESDTIAGSFKGTLSVEDDSADPKDYMCK